MNRNKANGVGRGAIVPAVAPELIATDLDGTLLGGTEAGRARLYSWLSARPPGRLLVFATGRGLESVLPVLGDPSLPTPDFIIADVGATVVRGLDLEPVQPLQDEISRRWPGTHAVLSRCARFGALARQEVPQERRASFELSGPLPEGFEDEVRKMGCDVLVSAGRYVDVLPAGVSKGSTLRMLIEHLGGDPSMATVAGDTLNDLSLYTIGARGVVVGNAEPALIAEVAKRERVFIADGPGADGIFEGLVHFGVASGDAAPEDRQQVEPGNAQLIMVYHRLPFDEVKRGGKTHRRRPKSPNGIIPSLLGFFAGGRRGCWVAWSAQPSRDVEGVSAPVPVDEERYPNLTASRIALTKTDVELFYKKFSKEAFWPVIFSFPGRAVFKQDHWEHFCEINRVFAERTAAEAEHGATVWLHDYNLWMVPGFLRALRPDLKIAFFHHTAFPPAGVFNILPWSHEIVGSLLHCDYVGFHIPRYVENFVDVVSAHAPTTQVDVESCAPRFVTFGCALGVSKMTTQIEVAGRKIGLGAHPVGIDVEHVESLCADPQIQAKMVAIDEEVGDRRCVLSVERLDYVKGPLEKINAFEKMLEDHPEHHGEVTLINIVTPPAPGMEVYRSIRQRLDEAVGRVNGRFGRIDWTPIRYFYRSLPFEDVIANYAVADVAWITPLSDGLNLVAKEYVATKSATGRGGALVLSEFAGVAVELHGALLTNPFDIAGGAETLHRALTMGDVERAERMKRMSNIVRHNDIRRWGEGFLQAIERAGEAAPAEGDVTIASHEASR